LAGHREVIARDRDGKVERHFVILPFAARWISGEVALNEELAEARWLAPGELAGLDTTEGLAEIVRAALALASCGSFALRHPAACHRPAGGLFRSPCLGSIRADAAGPSP